MEAKQVNDKDFLPYTNSYHQKAPYLVWNDRHTSHRKRKCGLSALRNEKCKCCQGPSMLVTVVSFIVIAMFAIVSFSAYLGVITRLFPKPVLILHGTLLVRKGDTFSLELLSKSSAEFVNKASKYEQMLHSIYGKSELKYSVADIKVHGFKYGSLLVHFRLYLDQDRSFLISVGEVVEKARVILENGLKGVELQSIQEIDITLLEMSGFYTSSNTSSFVDENELFNKSSDLNETEEALAINFVDNVFNYSTALDDVDTENVEGLTPSANDTITTTKPASPTQNVEFSDSHQNTNRPFELSYGPWVPFIPTSNPIATDRIITIPYSTSRLKESTIPFVDRIDDDEEETLLEERYLKQSSDANATNVLINLLRKTQLKPHSSLDSSVPVHITSQNASNISNVTGSANYSTPVLSDKFSALTANQPDDNKEQAWIPIIITPVPSAPSTTAYDHRQESNTSSEEANKSRPDDYILEAGAEYQVSESHKQSGKIFSKVHDFSDASSKLFSSSLGDGRWRGYSPLPRSDVRFGSTHKGSHPSLPIGRTGSGGAYAFPMDGHGYADEFVPITPPSTTEMVVGASLHINHRRKNSNHSYGNLRRISRPSSSPPTTRDEKVGDIEVYSPVLIKQQPSFQLSSDGASGKGDAERLSPVSAAASLNVTRISYVSNTNRYFGIRHLKNSSKGQTTGLHSSPLSSSVRSDRRGFAKVISSNIPNKNAHSSSPTKEDTNEKTEDTFQKGDAHAVPGEGIGSSSDGADKKHRTTITSSQEELSSSVAETCSPDQGVRCGKTCAPLSTRCNRKFDCDDKSDEMNCTCFEYILSKNSRSRMCDGIVDCWDQTDEMYCSGCSPEKFICPNTQRCIDTYKVCDGIQDCPFGNDERHCVTLAYNTNDVDNHYYRSSGYVALRKNGAWGMLCLENFPEETLTEIESMGQSVCTTLSYRSVSSARLFKNLVLKPSAYFQLQYANITSSTNHHVQQVQCHSKKLLHISCESLECGTRPIASNNRSRIVGGQSSVFGSWPWQVALYKEGSFQCGAVLISDQWLISAAHCFYHAKTAYWTARLGLLRRGPEFPSPYEEIRAISHLSVHPSYQEKGFLNDIAVLRMMSPVQFSDYIRPVCLPRIDEEIRQWSNQLCTVVGWGKKFETGRRFPDTLQEVWLPVFDTEECRKRTVFLPLYKITNEMFCAGYERGGRDACLGDSGGPLVCQRSDGKWTVVGITSNGDGCGRPGRPGVYTKVTSFLEWMQSILDDVPLPSDLPTCNGHRCELGQCISQKRVCNGVMDCWNGSDEAFCPVRGYK